MRGERHQDKRKKLVLVTVKKAGDSPRIFTYLTSRFQDSGCLVPVLVFVLA